jgi:hypothetical protein
MIAIEMALLRFWYCARRFLRARGTLFWIFQRELALTLCLYSPSLTLDPSHDNDPFH